MVTLHSHATRLGVLDIGSNTVHMLIVDAAPGARPEPEASTKSTIRLMQYLKDDGSIKKAGTEALLSAVGLLIVGGKVLERGAHALGLHAGDDTYGLMAGQIWVFRWQ